MERDVADLEVGCCGEEIESRRATVPGQGLAEGDDICVSSIRGQGHRLCHRAQGALREHTRKYGYEGQDRELAASRRGR